jgi:hypothetical protein
MREDGSISGGMNFVTMSIETSGLPEFLGKAFWHMRALSCMEHGTRAIRLNRVTFGGMIVLR